MTRNMVPVLHHTRPNASAFASMASDSVLHIQRICKRNGAFKISEEECAEQITKIHVCIRIHLTFS